MATAPRVGIANEAVAGTYDRFAAAYDRLVAPLGRWTRRRALALLDVGPGDVVLEFGSGPGRALVALGERVGPSGRVLGVDAAPAMVERARGRVRRADLADRVAVALGDARAPPVAAGAVDAVVVEDTLELFDPEDRRRVLAAARRALRPGGRLGVVTMERAGAADSRFVRAYDWAYGHVPGVRRFGCRPIRAREALERGGFQVEAAEHHRRAFVWPVEVLVATPAD